MDEVVLRVCKAELGCMGNGLYNPPPLLGRDRGALTKAT